MTAPPGTLRTLLTRLIDYAGLFPPAKLEMRPAVEEYAAQRRSEESWMLGRFIVPLARLDEFAREARDPLAEDAGSWPLSVLGGGEPAEDRRRIDDFNERFAGRARIEAIELKAPEAEAVERLAPSFQGLEGYFELPSELDPRPFVPALRRVGGRGKIRTGGVTPELIPEPHEVARFIHTLASEQIPFKATAGLHHPLRGEYPLTYEPGSARGTMFGFLNVFLAAAFAQQGSLDQQTLQELLEERDPGAFSFDDETVRWRHGDHHHEIDVATLALNRKLVATSYGSCSFAEPVDDLRALGLL